MKNKDIITFDIIGEIKTKLRPRFSKNGHAFTPKDTIMYENLIRTEYRRQCDDMNFKDKPLAVIVDCYFKASQILASFGEIACKLPCIAHKDLDNICKLVDALNGVAWNDDKQIIDLQAHKYYTLDEEKLTISIIDMSDQFDYLTIDDLKAKKYTDKLKARKIELENKTKLTKAERERLAKIKQELGTYAKTKIDNN